MLLCKECHKKSNCEDIFCEMALDDIIGGSYGECKQCGSVRICVDCHDNDLGKAAKMPTLV